MDDEQKKKNEEANEAVVIDEKGQIAEEKHVEKPETHQQKAEPENSRWQRFLGWYKSNKKKSIPLTILVLVLLLAGIPWSRYHLAGLVLKKDLALRVTDSTAGTPVSGADVNIDNIHAITNGSGKVTLQNVKVGPHTILVTKKYYKDDKTKLLVPIFKQKAVPDIHFVATGRQVKISVKDLINHAALADVDIKVADVSAKTDKSGNAVVVLPVGAASQKASLSLSGYNSATGTVTVSNSTIKENDFALTPAGKVYFLSKLSGKIDVVKTNLDGSDRQTVLAGTGREDDNNTVLLASRDWKYLALLSRRSGEDPSLYIIDTSNDSVTPIDPNSTGFQLIGWSDDYFTYVTVKNNIQPWQSGASSIKSYNAQTKQLTVLDSTNATGSNLADASYETYVLQPILLDNLIVYTKTWYQYPGYLQVSGQSNTLNVIKPNNTGKKTIRSLDASQSYFGSMVFHAPNSIYVQISNLDNSPSTYYNFNGSGLTQNNDLTNQDLFTTYPTYLYSPDDSQTFWSEPRDGKNTLFVGDENGTNGKQIATLSDYQTYGWYTENYLLVSKNSSELYIMPRNGPDSQAVKISDYHKPAQTFDGYGGGYGGL